MPKLIDYPRTTYSSAWEVAEITDDTGGKCAIETAARKLNRKVSGSFKAIIGSAVKFGLLTSKRDILTTTTLFKRIKHAYDKQEELVFHREAFLTPPLFTQLCRKFRSRELPVQMLDVMLIREFGVEEINAQGVAKAFTEGCRMVNLLDEHNIMADIDSLNAQRSPSREIASPAPSGNVFRTAELTTKDSVADGRLQPDSSFLKQDNTAFIPLEKPALRVAATLPEQTDSPDTIASLFGLVGHNNADKNTTGTVGNTKTSSDIQPAEQTYINASPSESTPTFPPTVEAKIPASYPTSDQNRGEAIYQLLVKGPGVDTSLSILEEEDITIAIALLEKIRRQLSRAK